MNYKEVINVLKNHKVAFADIPASGIITVYEDGLENAYLLKFENNILSHVEIMQTMVIECDLIKTVDMLNSGILIYLFNKNVFVGMFSASREV